MKRIPIESSIIKSVGYDYETFIFEVEFVKGSIYRYENVPVHSILQMLFKEKSSGSYFMKNIAKNYEYTKVSD